MDVSVLALIVRADRRPPASTEWRRAAFIVGFGASAIAIWLGCSLMGRPKPPPPVPPARTVQASAASDALLAPPPVALGTTPTLSQDTLLSPPASVPPHVFMGTMVREHDGPLIVDSTDDEPAD